jgi:hypothetical protein
MSIEAPIGRVLNLFIGEDKTLTFYVMTGNDITTAASAAKSATTVQVAALTQPLSSGDKVRFGAGGGASGSAGVGATLSAAAAIGDTSLAVNALPGAIARSVVGRKIQDITGYTMEWVLRAGPTAVSDLLTKTIGDGITITDAGNGICQVALAADDTADSDGVIIIQPGDYFHTLRKTNAGDESVLAFGLAVLRLGATR